MKLLDFLRCLPAAMTSKPNPNNPIVQVDGSGITVCIAKLRPVILPPPIKENCAPSVIENGARAVNAAVLLPEKLSGSVIGVPDTVSNRVPGVLFGLAPCVLLASAQNLSVLTPL